ncbi:putative membrane protein [Haloactinopolyspora alba]|uniref:Putative membrane protein n=1 Tax=Haloactinopolyspora alba TaxID=648780 RepID=A0A2P8DYZ3_9ACTN|nr:PH domain-containing protein [Haloactinopolyspora alba]PSL02431.1 putative membrane protein [Haloactinopolyspora alba]
MSTEPTGDGETPDTTPDTASDTVSGTAAERPAPASGTPEHFRRLHPLTPLLRGWAFLAAAIAFGGQDALRSGEMGRFGLTVVAIAVLGMITGLVSWWFTRYGFDGDALRIDSGVLNRRSRRVRLDRLQAVDINRPLAGRLLGVSELRMEVAGGGKSEAPLQYLGVEDAIRLRAELLARAAGIDADTPEAPERSVHEVPLERLVWSTLLSGVFVFGLVILVGIAVAFAVVPDRRAILGVGWSILPAVIAIGAALWNQLGRNFGFVLSESPDGYRIRKGLLDTQHQTVPPGRVQGVAMRQPLLWRWKGWVRLDVDVAGYAGESTDDSQRTSTLLPVATVEEATTVLRYVLAGSDPLAVPLHPAPRPARWLRPIGWRRLAYGADDHVVVVREGVLYRNFTAVPHAKTQSVRVVEGPLQRRLGLATVRVDTTPGPVDAVIRHRYAHEARVIVRTQAERARLARKADVPEQWMSRRQAPAGGGDPDGDADGDGQQTASIERDQE